METLTSQAPAILGYAAILASTIGLAGLFHLFGWDR